MPGKLLEDWRVFPLPLDNLDRLKLEKASSASGPPESKRDSGPAFFRYCSCFHCGVKVDPHRKTVGSLQVAFLHPLLCQGRATLQYHWKEILHPFILQDLLHCGCLASFDAGSSLFPWAQAEISWSPSDVVLALCLNTEKDLDSSKGRLHDSHLDVSD